MPKVKRLISNCEDDYHCFQACFGMVYETLTGEDISMDRAEALTGFVAGRPTWSYKGILSWADRGLYVRYIENFPPDSFIENPERTIRNHLGNDDLAQEIIDASDLQKETELVKLCLSHPNVIFDVRQPSLEDIQQCIKEDALVVVNVNYWGLLGKDKYNGHFVVVEAIDETSVLLQNPGLPPVANQVVPKELFLKAWLYPNEKLANIIAVS